MIRTAAAFLLAATSAETTLASDNAHSAQASQVRVLTSISQPLWEGAGSRGAGLACFPNGRFHLSDFVRSEVEFQKLTETIFGSMQGSAETGSTESISIDLKSIEARLCARGYGMFGRGDTRSMSGEAVFAFDWSRRGAAGSEKLGSSRIVVTLKKSEARMPEDILAIALTNLGRDLFAQNPAVPND